MKETVQGGTYQDVKGCEVEIGHTRLRLAIGNIVDQPADILVNAANVHLLPGAGVCGAIFEAAGKSLERECELCIKLFGEGRHGCTAVTTAGNITTAKYIVHAVGPIWYGGNKHEAEVLDCAYYNSMYRAEALEAKSIAFPSLSTGVYGFPVKEAAKIALASVIKFLREEKPALDTVIFVLYDKATYDVYEAALKELINGEVGDKAAKAGQEEAPHEAAR